MRAAVIGARGFLGAEMARGLEAAGWAVVPVVRGDTLPGGRFDVVVDCAGDARRFYCNVHPRHAFDANVAPVLDRVLGLDTGLYVLASTIDVYGGGRASAAGSDEAVAIEAPRLDTYSFTKAMAEQVVAHHAAASLILRLGTLIGPGLRKNPVFDAWTGQPLRIGDDTTLSLVDTRFVVEALLALAAAGARGIVNVTGSGQVGTADLIAAVAERRPGWSPVFHAERQDFQYDIAVGRLSSYLPVPSGGAMLRTFLADLAREEVVVHG